MTIQFVDWPPPPSLNVYLGAERKEKIISLNVLIQHDESCIQASGVNN